MGLPWKRWGETDIMLALAWEQYEDETCPVCGEWIVECRDELTDGRWQVETVTDFAQAALDDYREQYGSEAMSGQLLALTLLKDGEAPRDGGGYDPERARAAYAQMRERLGLPDEPDDGA